IEQSHINQVKDQVDYITQLQSLLQFSLEGEREKYSMMGYRYSAINKLHFQFFASGSLKGLLRAPLAYTSPALLYSTSSIIGENPIL
ncbi:hypothetical protein FRX31_012733, partial [Thalictrum thalictroides]